MKNCGQTVHDEVASKQTMEELKELLKVTFILSTPCLLSSHHTLLNVIQRWPVLSSYCEAYFVGRGRAERLLLLNQ